MGPGLAPAKPPQGAALESKSDTTKCLSMPESKPSPAETLKKVPLFAGLSERELAFLAGRAVSLHAKAGELLFSEGEPCKGLYVIESGAVKIFKTSASGREQVLTIEGRGQSIAELQVGGQNRNCPQHGGARSGSGEWPVIPIARVFFTFLLREGCKI